MKFPAAHFAFLVLITTTLANTPTYQNVVYSEDFERCKMDIWLPDSNGATSVIVYFHGGGFKKGDKTHITFKKDFLSLVKKGVAIISVGYPLLGDTGKDDEIGTNDYEKILTYTASAVEHIQQNSASYNLDLSRLVFAGNSAGALISGFLTYEKDFNASACIAIQQPWALQRVLDNIEKDEAPIILYTRSGEDDQTHHPRYAMATHEHCQRVGVTSYLYGSKASGLPTLPENQNFVQRTHHILSEIWE
ncbi:MAG: alpha/beta hydrolase [Opitutales bacterium]|nr:alpha/beta hydrolase [Opitutales bacterium]